MRRTTHPSRAEVSVRGAGPDRLLDVHEAAAFLAVKPATLYQWAHQAASPGWARPLRPHG
jgi:hypothetical protein